MSPQAQHRRAGSRAVIWYGERLVLKSGDGVKVNFIHTGNKDKKRTKKSRKKWGNWFRGLGSVQKKC